MKRAVALSILGVALVPTTNALGTGYVIFNNYHSPYNPITYDLTVPDLGGQPVGAGEGVQIEVWWALGKNKMDSDLVFGANADFSYYAGYTSPVQYFTIPEYLAGQTWTLQLRASGTAGGQPVDSLQSRGPRVETDNIGNGNILPPEPPGYAYTPGFVVTVIPEPTTLALAGLGAAALLFFRLRD